MLKLKMKNSHFKIKYLSEFNVYMAVNFFQCTTILYTVLFDEFYNIVWYCSVLNVGYNI